MIEVQNLTKSYGQLKAVNNLNFTVNTGEILGFLGPNGAGKSTTMNIITGYIPATSGTVKVCGFDVMEQANEVKKIIGYLPEIPPLYMDMTVNEYLNFVSDLKLVDKTIKKSRLDDIVQVIKLEEVRGRLIKNLSKGYKQRVGLAQAIVGGPKVLILDEPTVGLDPKQIIEIRNLIKNFGKEHTIILSSHILPEVSAVCERVVIINKGQIVAVDTPENLSSVFKTNSSILVTIEGEKDAIIDEISKIKGVTEVKPNIIKEDSVVTYNIEMSKDADIRKPLFFAMANLGTPILEMKSMDVSLEDIFLELTTDEKEVEMDDNNI